MTFRGASLVSTMESKKFLSQTNSKDVNEIAPSNRRVSFNFIRENAAFTFLKNQKTLHIFNSKNNTTTNRTMSSRNKLEYVLGN